MSSQRSRSTVTASSRRSSQRGLVRPAQMALVAMGGVLLIYAQAVAALGVGEPRYLSHLFEPLRVDVPVDTRGVDPAAVKVGISISGVDAAAAAEIEGRLHREWQRDGEGRHVLRISTDQPIHEPMMQMRVEVGDDRIQAIRELTLLLDPAPVDVPAAASLQAEAVAPAVVAPLAAAVSIVADEAPQAVAEAAPEAEASTAVRPIAITRVAPISTVIHPTAPVSLAPASRAVAADVVAPAVVAEKAAAAPVSPPRPQAASAAARAAAAAPIVLAPKALLAAPALVRPIADPAAALLPVASSLRLPSSLSEQIASTRRPQALSAADRWQRLVVGRGDTLDSLAARARGEQTTIPLPMVAMLLRWLNPRAFDGVGREPLVGAELRFPKPESLAAQIAISGGVWTVDDVTAGTDEAARAVVPPPSFQVLNPHSADDFAAAMGIGTALLAGRPAATASPLPSALSAGRGAGAGGLAASGTVVGGAVVAGLLSMLMMLNMVVTTPAPARSRTVPATVVARHVGAPARAEAAAATRALPAESLDLATLDLASLDALRAHAAPVARGHADS